MFLTWLICERVFIIKSVYMHLMEKKIATHSSILQYFCWALPWAEELGGL